MLGRRSLSFLKRSAPPHQPPPLPIWWRKGPVEEDYQDAKHGSEVRVTVFNGLNWGCCFDPLDDLAICNGCSSKAMEKASKNQAIIDAIGEPIVRGPWYNASLRGILYHAHFPFLDLKALESFS